MLTTFHSIIVPANIKSQWRAEINRMAPELRVLEYSGIPKIKGEWWRSQ